jgi:hypothetical protein
MEKSRTSHIYMGTVSMADFIDKLHQKTHGNSGYSMRSVVATFTSLAVRECALYDMRPSYKSVGARDILRSVSHLHRICIGRAKLIDLLKLLTFESWNRCTTLVDIMNAIEQMAEDEIVWEESRVAKKVARANKMMAVA